MSFTYLSIPYSHSDAVIRAKRMEQFWRAAAHLIRRGDHVVSPMTLEPALRAAPDLPYDWNHWQAYSLKMMGISDRLVVLMLVGWLNSSGVGGEIEEAERLGLPIEYLSLEELR